MAFVHHWCMHEDLLSRLPPSIDDDAGGAAGTSQAPDGVPPIRSAIRGALALADRMFWNLSGRLLPEKPSLVTVAFHSLCASRALIDDPALAPNQNVSVVDFRNLVETVLDDGYAAVSPAQVDAGLPDGGKYVMFTFDDGYFNNVLALDVLNEFRVPATFFVSSNHVLEGKAFWWDALNRQLLKAGATEHQRNRAIAEIKALSADRIEDHLRSRYGVRCLLPSSDRDRPFTRSELAHFARQPWVHLGNHTCDHAILTRCPPSEMRRQIQECQDALQAICGYAPLAISYPNGDCSPAVVEAALASGLRLGLTVRPSHNRLPLRARRLLNLGRFYFYGDSHPRDELLKWRAGYVPSSLLKRALRRAH